MTKPQHNPPHRTVRSFVRRSGRMTRRQRQAYSRLYERFGIRPKPGLLDFEEIFGRRAPVVLEIGFGMGETTAQVAANHPEKNFLAVDVHIPGIGNLVARCEEMQLENVRIIEGDALDILDAHIADDSLAALYIYFPDPWPKKRHHKRRLIQPATTRLFAQKLMPGGYLHVATDWPDYATQILACFRGDPALQNTASGFAPRPPWRPQTKFERKALREGRATFDILFRKIGQPE